MARPRTGMAALCLALGAMSGSLPAPAQSGSDLGSHDEITGGGAWRFSPIPCVDTKVTSVRPRLGDGTQQSFGKADFDGTGVVVEMALPPGFRFMTTTRVVPSVVHYQGDQDNAIMRAQRPGDRVQVCLLSFPTPTYDAGAKRFICDPDADARGFVFRVYSYRQRAAYYGPNSQHGCGGA